MSKTGQFFSDERVKVALGLLITGSSLFLFLAFVSYFFTWKADQSFEWSALFSGAEIQVENWSGKAGAWMAALFMNRWFGIASFGFPFLLFIGGIRLMGVRMLPLRKTVRITLIALVLLSVTLGYLSGSRPEYLGSGPGGAHGWLVSQWLNALLGIAGTGILLLVANCTFIFFTIPGSHLLVTRLIQRKPRVNEMPGPDEDLEVKEDLIKEVEGETVSLVFEKPVPVERPQVRDTRMEVKNAPGEAVEENIELIVDDVEPDDEVEENLVEDHSGLANPYDPKADLPRYQFPSLNLLDDHKLPNTEVSNEELIRNKDRIVETLKNYKIEIDHIKATVGPTVTLYEIVPAAGVRISKIKNLEDDIALSLAALGIRIIAPIPGRGTIGIEVPNQQPEVVSMKSILASKKFQESGAELAIALGKTISNETYVFDLAKLPHLLVAGATGQGKSVGLNAIITSLLYKKHPAEIKFIMVDPKKVELTPYARLEKHFLAQLPDEDEAIITDTQKVINTLNSLTIEMEQRYDLLKMANVRNIKEYNTKFLARSLNPEKGHRFLPYLIVIVDEFADLIMTAGREIEGPLARLAQLARAIGIHLIIATQRPSTNIITGVIKANFPARLAFKVSSMIDSRTILDTPGANQLVGRGDLLITTGGDLVRVQCAFIDTAETERLTEFIGNQQGYPIPFYLPEYHTEEEGAEKGPIDLKKRDELFDEAARMVVMHQMGSTSLIQRRFSIGYNRAGRLMDQLEAAGIVGQNEGSKARRVLIVDEMSLEQILNSLG
jgi:DNA segregation ATPase FtsK/SpoIIIE, S-DNA-T family